MSELFCEIWGFVDSTAFSNIIAILAAALVYYNYDKAMRGSDSLANDRKRLHWIYNALERDDGELDKLVKLARADNSKGESKGFISSLSPLILNKAKERDILRPNNK